MRARSQSLLIGAILLVGLAGGGAVPALAQESYPSRPVLLTHGFAAGGNGDVVSRIIADALSPRLGQPVIVEPRPGAGGNTASARLAKADSDGYTLISLTGGHAVSAAIYRSLPFDPLADFEMVSIYGYQAFMLAVRKDSPIRSVADLINAAKAAPGKLTYSSVGVGSTQLARLNGALRQGLAEPAVDARLRKIGMEVKPSSPEEMRDLVSAQITRWKQVVADAKIPQQ